MGIALITPRVSDPEQTIREEPLPVTDLLRQWQSGDRDAFDRLVPGLYNQLRRLASGQLRRERSDHTLKSTALVHEMYLEFAGQSGISFDSRSHFLAIAARLMRQLLTRHARERCALKRGGSAVKTPLDDEHAAVPDACQDTLDLDQAISELATEDAFKAQIVELRYFGGLTTEELAGVTGVSVSTISREMRAALAWLRFRLQTEIAS